MTMSLQGYSTASHYPQPALEDSPHHDPAPRPEDVPLMLLLAATKEVTAESVVEAMVSAVAIFAFFISRLCLQHSDINPFTTRARSPTYKSLLEKRLPLPVYAQLQKFCKMVSSLVHLRRGSMAERRVAVHTALLVCPNSRAEGITNPVRPCSFLNNKSL